MAKTTRREALGILGGAAAVGLARPAIAQQPQTVKFVNVVELSGAGVTSGTNWRDGIELAVRELNAAGGILGRRIEVQHLDTASNPGQARALVTRAIDQDPYILFGPVFSGSVMVSMAVAQEARMPQFTGGEATAITAQGNPYIFRTSFSQVQAMPKVAAYLKDQVRAQSVSIIWVNNDFGKGGRDAIMAELQRRGVRVAIDVSTEQNQVDFSSAVLRAKNANADALFVYLNEDESARILREIRRQGYDKPIIGETVLPSQQVIELAGDAANGIRGHVGLTVNAPIPAIQDFSRRFQAAFNRISDHNGIKGFFAVHVVNAVTKRLGRFDRQAFAEAMKNIRITTADAPGVLMDVSYDDKGNLDRDSFLVEVRNGRQEVVAVLPPIGRS
ncbi:MAG: amino acid ABC transporter substrate-binding protein [Alphaproteobacteria bacterium]|nr:amino acid ABC transporter substrate-binding protein [Alphaproteobacteria bacterium]